MRILYFYQYFTTPKGSWGTRAYEFARRWVDAGHDVLVITSVYDKSDLQVGGLTGISRVDGIDVRVINVGLSNKHGTLRRVFTFLLFTAVAAWFALTERADVVLCSSGPLTVGIPGLVAKWIRRRPLVFELRDLFAEGLRQLGVVRSELVLWAAEWFERFLCRRADVVVALSPGMADWLRDHWSISGVRVIPNAADNDLFGQVPGEALAERRPPRPAEERWAIYAGTIGPANNCKLLLDAADLLKNRGLEHIRIVLIGDGKERRPLEELAERRALSNVSFVNPLPKEHLVSWMHEATVALLVLQGIPVFDTVSPNKLFDALAAGLPSSRPHRGGSKTCWRRSAAASRCRLTIRGRWLTPSPGW